MKHLLTALIAALVLVLPLYADEPTQRVSVRVIDHEGRPVVGLALSVSSGEHTYYGLTDEDGVMTTSVKVPAYGRSAIIRPQPEEFVVLGDFRGSTTTISSSKPDSYQSQLLAKHSEILKTHSIDKATPVSSIDLVDGIFTLQLPESVRCSVNIRFSGLSAHGTDGWWLLRRDGLPRHLRSGVPHALGVNWERGGPSVDHVLREAVVIPSGDRTPIGFLRLSDCFLLDVSIDDDRQRQLSIEFESPRLRPAYATVHFNSAAGAGQYGHFLVSADGARGSALDLNPFNPFENLDPRGMLRTHHIDHGEYLMVSAPARSGIGFLWSPDSVFDTMLRLRRGEDLPHLKRITIPEGGTVELSTEDFLDPPAETETPAEANPR